VSNIEVLSLPRNCLPLLEPAASLPCTQHHTADVTLSFANVIHPLTPQLCTLNFQISHSICAWFSQGISSFYTLLLKFSAHFLFPLHSQSLDVLCILSELYGNVLHIVRKEVVVAHFEVLPCTWLQELRKATETFRENGGSQGLYLNPERPEYEPRYTWWIQRNTNFLSTQLLLSPFTFSVLSYSVCRSTSFSFSLSCIHLEWATLLCLAFIWSGQLYSPTLWSLQCPLRNYFASFSSNYSLAWKPTSDCRHHKIFK
jgi:hypothetical protein